MNRAFGAEPELDARQQLEAAEQRAVRPGEGRRRARAASCPSSARWPTAVEHAASAPSRHPGGVSGLTTGLRDLDKQDGRAAPVGPDDPRRPAGHGEDRAGDQDRLRRRASRMLREAREDNPNAVPARRRGDLLAGNERRPAGHAPAVGGSAHLRRPHPPRRHRAARLRPFVEVSREIAAAAARDRRHAGHHHLARCARAAGGCKRTQGASTWSWWTTCS